MSGIVATLRREPDGDYHVGLRLDGGQEALLNDRNRTGQAGDLVVEIICANPVTQADAVSACAGYTSTVLVPAIGQRISVTGPYVLDLDHGWNEIHPAWSIVVVSAPTTLASSSPTSEPANTTSQPPQTAAAPSTGFVVGITTSRYGFLAAVTTAGANCGAQARLPSGRMSTAQGLQASQTADPAGNVSWTYGTTSRTTPGSGTHTITCVYQGQTLSASAPFSVP